MTKIAIIGPGAIGGTLAAWLDIPPNNEIFICARSSFQSLSVETPFGKLESTPTVFTNPAQAEQVDWVIVTTKAYQIPSIEPWFKHLCHADTKVAVAQNGVEHIANLTPFIPAERLVPIIIDTPAARVATGKIIQKAPILMAIPNNKLSLQFASLFPTDNVTINLTDDWTSAAWKKLCINSPGAVSSIVNQHANIAGDPKAESLMRNMIRECIAVGRAEGATIDDEIIEQVLSSQRHAPAGSMNSLHADLAAKRPMEWDARNGVIHRLGKKHGIATPYNEMAAHILSLIETHST
ncbi:MAG: 2-dehydropantoate 2-reductase [Alphaproteobacteria bacterium]|nr:2-dehydropantoate 2-reductase [Alphaproteobacteria bacterium]